MIVSWNWLKEYLRLDMPPAEVERRLMMAGLNHESTERVGDDLAIDLEVTSNRPDCLGHLGIAREIAVLFDLPLKQPAAAPREGKTPADSLTSVTFDCPQLCYRYTARVIRGVKIAPSPAWLARRLEAIGVAVINNVVDITNYVLMETGQPLHAFDFAKLKGHRIVVRAARPGEQFLAIDHKTYALDPGVCVIADAERTVALGGVMGGADSEVSDRTTEILLEAAEFDPLSIRTTARKLNLHSPSSYRFERTVDPQGVDWASRRAAELILELAGGELAAGVVAAGREPVAHEPIVLRLAQIERVLGIRVPTDEVRRILVALGNSEKQVASDAITVVPPSWRRDLSREIDLIEEVARIHGYDKIPEDVAVPMVPSHRSERDRVLARARHVLTAAGFDEALTPSIVSHEWSAAYSPWTATEPLTSNTPLLRGADQLRRSLVPSLLGARRINEALANSVVELFEIARVYLPQATGLPVEEPMISLVSGGDFARVKGVVEALVRALAPQMQLEVVDASHDLLDSPRAARLQLGGEVLGYLGEVSQEGRKQFQLKSPATVAELRVAVLEKVAVLVRRYQQQSAYPAVVQDLNFVVDESLRWAELSATVTGAAGEVLEDVAYAETYRDLQKDGAGKKRLLLSITLRSRERTLTSDEAEAVRSRIISACQQKHGAVLLA